jgi:hypothetical protein
MTARRNALYIATGCLFYLGALIATLPATWMAYAIERISRQNFQLRNPAGTAWSGSGQLYVTQSSGHLLDIGLLRWNTLLSGIPAGRLGVDLVLGSATSAMHLELSPASVAIRGLSLELPGTFLSIFAPRLETLGPQGKLLVRSDSLRFDENSILGLANIEWRSVRLARAPGLDFGSHVARLRGGGGKIDIELGTIEGSLRLSGGGTWAKDSGLNVIGAIENGEDQSTAMGAFMQGVCSEYRNRRCDFRITQ